MMTIYKIDKSYHIGRKSSLNINGSTNINAFSCRCTEAFPFHPFSMSVDDNCNATFHDTKLKILVRSLDCGNILINQGMFKALNSDEHPHITIELLKAIQGKDNRQLDSKNWSNIRALTRITINGKSREHWLNITARKLAGEQFHFVGTKSLTMTEFGITPPVAMLGMIRVKDEIRVDVDMEITLK
jgi:hypothetical protein